MVTQQDLVKLSTNSTQHIINEATHSALTEDKEMAGRSAQAIRDVLNSIRANTNVG
jgi:hypothetical protein